MIHDWVARTPDGKEFQRADLLTTELLRAQPITEMVVKTAMGYITIACQPDEIIHLFTRVQHTLGEGPIPVPCAEIRNRTTGRTARVFLHPERGIIFSSLES